VPVAAAPHRLGGLVLSLWLFAAACQLGPGDAPEIVDASSSCWIEEVERLLGEGADPNDREFDGIPPIAAAAHGGGPRGLGCLQTLKVLREAGGTLDATETGISVLAMAAFGQGDPDVVEWLVQQGADPCEPLPEWLVERYDAQTLAELARLEQRPAAVIAAIEQAIRVCEAAQSE